MFRTSLSEGVKVGDKTYSLASFGIMSGDYSEKGILHIHGDEDFAKVASNDNKLMEALSNNPEEVRTVLNTIADKLYSSLMNKMKSTTLSSALTVYNDKELSKTLDNHKSDLKKLEAKLAKIEEKYYKQFAAMESAMAKMNAQSSSLMSMLGINTGQN
jgi:flagellar hook-associated protein 2